MSNLLKNEQEMKKVSIPRITAIDFVRGLAIILMALDHASSFWNIGRFGIVGAGLTSWSDEAGAFTGFFRPVYPDLLNFLVRFVTHWCAPTFVFLAGTSIVLFEAKRLEKGVSQSEISKHLIIRGLILLVIEWTIIAWAFRAAPFYFGVLALLGVGFIVFAFTRRVNPKIILTISLILFLEPFIDSFIFQLSGRNMSIFYLGFIFEQFPTGTQELLLTATFWPNWPYGLYPLDPWLGVMGLGFVFGHWLRKQKLPEDNRFVAKRLALTGGVSIGVFFILRLIQGWPINYLGIWEANGVLRPDAFTIETFFLLAKYPPSLGFLLWTLGGMCLALSLAFYFQDQDWFQKWTLPVVLFGSTPLFFYSIHLLIYGAVPILTSIILLGEPTHYSFITTLFTDAVFLSLLVTLAVWIIGLLILYPACLEFKKLKKRYPDSLFQYI
ncbi:MAG: DUF1624 domain-containing protein [Candidatus Hodarchaeales archaeon]|jgi:uncharacterized membrane protein